MKRLSSAALALTLALGPVPAQAQTAFGRVSAPAPVAGPAPVPAGFVAPAAGFALAPSAPALALSLIPAPYINLTPAVPVLPEALPARAAAARIAAPVLAPARGGTSLELLTYAADPARSPSGAAFDGSLARSAAASMDPAPAPEPAAASKKRGLLARYRDHRKGPSTPFSIFGKSLFAGAIAAAALPVVSGAAPAAKLLYAVLAADVMSLGLIVPLGIILWAARKLRRAPQTASRPPPTRRKIAVMIALGLALGMGIGTAPYQATGPAVERFSAMKDRGEAPAEKAQVRWIAGGAVEAETVEMLSKNPVGRATLEGLRDRFGVLRLPTFFISKQDGSYAQHENMFDGVYLNESEITDRGWTVEAFFQDPALQRRLIREMSSTVVHELTHAVQGRRPPWTPGYFKSSIECEQEAFFQEMLFRLAELERDPAARNDGHDSWMVPDAADGIDGFLKSVAGMYENNVVIGRDPYFNAYIAAQRARWPAFRVHIYEVLAARAATPRSAKMYLDKAAAAAKEAGLPKPAALASR